MSAVSTLTNTFSNRDGGIQQIMEMRQQIIDRSQILREIHASDTTSANALGASSGVSASGSPAPGFAETLRSALDGVNAVQNRAETISTAYQQGEVTDVAKVMLARQEAGIAFEATMQVRNKLLSAYQDIMRMGV